MADFLKNLKSIFIVSDEEDKVVDDTKSKPKPSKSAPKTEPKQVRPQSKADAAPVMAATSGRVNQKFVEILLKAIKANDLEGFDYLEFKQALRSLTEMQMTEEMRYKSAYAMAKSMGVDAKHILESGAHYKKVLETEESKFLQTLKSRQEGFADNRQKIAKLEQWEQEQLKKIEEIKASIEARRKEQERLKEEMSNGMNKINSVKMDFEVSYDHLLSQINMDLENIKKYLS